MIYPKPIVGQPVGFVPANRRDKPQDLVVTKVGRKYFECGRHNVFHLDSWRERSDYATAGRAYLDQAQHADAVERQKYWDALQRAVRDERRAPSGVSVDAMRRAAAILNIKFEKPE